MESNVGADLLAAVGSKDPYEILGLADRRDASADDIKKAYRKAALRNHPDKGGDAEKFKACCVARTDFSEAAVRAERLRRPPAGPSNCQPSSH